MPFRLRIPIWACGVRRRVEVVLRNCWYLWSVSKDCVHTVVHHPISTSLAALHLTLIALNRRLPHPLVALVVREESLPLLSEVLLGLVLVCHSVSVHKKLRVDICQCRLCAWCVR